jgi:hypothetical protein
MKIVIHLMKVNRLSNQSSFYLELGIVYRKYYKTSKINQLNLVEKNMIFGKGVCFEKYIYAICV